tara:strand:+ start:235 stop:573 length:339 start_codon:yes stop_codon:yes gene_type:complete
MDNTAANARSLRARTRSVHTFALSDGEELVVITEDVCGHNTSDRLHDECLRLGINPRGMISVLTGHVSSEMINKTVKIGLPSVASHPWPMSISVARRARGILPCVATSGGGE